MVIDDDMDNGNDYDQEEPVTPPEVQADQEDFDDFNDEDFDDDFDDDFEEEEDDFNYGDQENGEAGGDDEPESGDVDVEDVDFGDE